MSERYTMKVMDIKGKAYIPTNERLKAFHSWDEFKELVLTTEIIEFSDTTALVKATVAHNTGTIVATGHAYERVNQGPVNKTSHLENCETSAVGRCLGILGIGIDTAIASSDEVRAVSGKQETSQVQSQEMKEACTDLCELIGEYGDGAKKVARGIWSSNPDMQKRHDLLVTYLDTLQNQPEAENYAENDIDDGFGNDVKR